jgi:signal transduction histidine kinase
MQTPDSYDALAASIERALRSDIAPQASASQLAASIDHTLLEEARTGELRLAWLRAAVALASVIVSAWTLTRTDAVRALTHPFAGTVLRILWTLGALALLLALRRGWYRRWLRYVAPAVDGLMIWASFRLFWANVPDERAPMLTAAVGYVTVLCSFLAVSGAARLSRSSTQLSTALAVAVFLSAAATTHVAPAFALAIVATLAAMGALAAGGTTLIRRVVTNQVGRLEMSRMYDEARRAVDAREEVLKIVSHDLRNPLATISMSADLMLEVPLPDEQRVRRLTMIKRAGERMNRLIQDLLDVAKLEAGRLGITARPVDVSALLVEAEEMLRPLAAEKSIRLERTIGDGLPSVMADPGRVLQVIGNLVGNAIKFTPTGGRITLKAERVGSEVRFSVSDTGSGIPADQLPHIFGQFWQGDRTDRRGIGLGLAIAKGLVEAHGGRISVESRVGEGTTFWFTLGSDARRVSLPDERRGAPLASG